MSRFLLPVSCCVAVTVLLDLIPMTLLQILALRTLGIKLVLTFRSGRGFPGLLESIGDVVGLMVMIRIRGPCLPRIRFILATAFLALMLDMRTLIPLLALC